uniref:SnoaL-like domain-containing protein n=1 Tax=Pseudo-nitzschia australis TaxID=44445 RepID=A0A7S4EF29_9STRA|mmetsp:Transcript_13/g.31  ORF Transcript_13/g.31 Transcript_13/m.31 type:complete len:342 (+) Transcript_13:178-1203(+)|eukprot:CAMPEP_0168208194 /NCGR_PEP_ID=MMETSP0140_2-20121125/1933_1 /TAXON_ID=44445 /ORGANISM="Pseudo-nitzschia australis, Strain 10249 10 AB" /LENGTH=341 /DNA_ID=CAMNT_0008134565 /DNA_START=158 /DNA_END=1183 /DNA_ORIENTATION=+
MISFCKTIILLNLSVAFTCGFMARPHVAKSSSLMATIQREDVDRFCKARELVHSLVEEEKCFSKESGAVAFGEVCAANCIYEDCFEPQPFVGKRAVTNHVLSKVNQRKGKGDVRIDRISDGNSACGFAWTWVTQDGKEEGLRGTTFVELNDNGEIQYIREIPEPLYKPGDLTLELLKSVTKDAVPKPPPSYESKTPQSANEVAKYLFCEVQGGDIDESMRLFSDSIIYRDFNYEEVLRGKSEVRKFIEDFSFPGIEFKPERFDDGKFSTCFTWDVCLDGQEDSIKGMSFYELDPESRLVTYVRDVPESAIKPPPLGGLARALRPGLGVFQGVPFGSRQGGM